MCEKFAKIFLCHLAAAALFVMCCEAYTSVVPPDPANPGKCVFRGDTLKLGYNPGNAPCQSLTCNEDGSIRIDGCGKLRIENCNRGERLNTNKPFPECCTLKYKCKNSDGSFYFLEKDLITSTDKTENET